MCSRTYHQVANQNLEDLGLQAGAAGKDLLKNADQNVAEWRTDEHAVERHLRNARAEVVAMLADVVGDPGSEQFLQTRQHTGGEHLGAQWVGLELAKVGLRRSIPRVSDGLASRNSHMESWYIPPDSLFVSFHPSIAPRRGAPGPQACLR